jgi:hypothetical protein
MCIVKKHHTLINCYQLSKTLLTEDWFVATVTLSEIDCVVDDCWLAIDDSDVFVIVTLIVDVVGSDVLVEVDAVVVFVIVAVVVLDVVVDTDGTNEARHAGKRSR